MLRASIRDERNSAALKLLEALPKTLDLETPVVSDVEQLARKAYIKTERVREALLEYRSLLAWTNTWVVGGRPSRRARSREGNKEETQRAFDR